jgi:hypothetical protein
MVALPSAPSDDEPLEQTGWLGMSRSHTFPFPEWRARDEHRTVFFDEGERAVSAQRLLAPVAHVLQT